MLKSIEINVVLGAFSFKVIGRDLEEVKSKLYKNIHDIGVSERVHSARVCFIVREHLVGVTDTRDSILNFKESETLMNALGKCFIKLNIVELFCEDNYKVELPRDVNSICKLSVILGTKGRIFLRTRGSVDSIKEKIEKHLEVNKYPVEFLRVQIELTEFLKLSDNSCVTILESKSILGFNHTLKDSLGLSELIASKIIEVRGTSL